MTTTTVRASLVDFAAAVLERCARVEAGNPHRFGRKVFISALEPSKTTKQLLVEAHREGLLELSRADLTPAFDRGLVEASETAYLNATFHFVAPRH